MNLLIQFLLRLSFGLAAGMAITSSKRVTSGYFRINLYVTLGLTALAALLCRSAAPDAFWFALAATVCSYIGSVCWLYERPLAGKTLLLFVLVAALLGSLREQSLSEQPHTILFALSIVSSGLLLGMTMAAMLLGHWYLNSPTMELAPLRRLIIAMGVAVCLQAVVSLLGLWGELASVSDVSTRWVLFVTLRWLFGLIGVAALAWMAWQTLKVPNTQSATGILYVAVIGTFVGETMALLLSRESFFPL
jgi:hypothetical protein